MQSKPASGDGWHKIYWSLFGGVFAVTYVLSILTFPIVLVALSGSTSQSNGTGFALVLSYIVAVGFGMTTLVKAAVVGAVAFTISILILDQFLPRFLVFTTSCVISAFWACYAGLIIDVDIFPPDISLSGNYHGLGMWLGFTASILSAVVSTCFWLASSVERKAARNNG